MKQWYTSCYNANLHLSKWEKIISIISIISIQPNPVPQVEPQPVMQPSRNPSHGRPTRSQAPGKNSKIPNCQNPSHSGKQMGSTRFGGQKFGESSIKYRNTAASKQNSCVFLMLLKWISYVTSTHLPVFESQKFKGPTPRASWQHDAWINNEGSLFVWSLKGATSCIPLQSIF